MSKTIFSDKHWQEMCNVGMEEPVPLHEADLSQPFVYSRVFGVFYVEFGRHQLAMSTLLAWQHGFLKAYEVADTLNLSYFDKTADYWLSNVPGTAFKSSVGSSIMAGKRGNLNSYELRWLKNVTYLFKDED